MKRAVCLDCRTLLDAGDPCDGGPRHRVVALDREGRARLVDEVWGPPPLRARAKQLARAGTAGGAAGAASQCGLGDCMSGGGGGCDVPTEGDALVVVLVILLAIGVGVLLYWIIAALVRYVRAKKNALKPNAAHTTPKLEGVATVRGRAQPLPGADPLRSPVKHEEVLVWEATFSRERGLMLREGRSTAFVIACDDGRAVHVPAGHVRLAGPATRGQDDDDRLFSGFGLAADEGEEYPPVPFDRLEERVVRAGDEVELLVPVMQTADASRSASYREAASVLAPAVVPRLRVIATVLALLGTLGALGASATVLTACGSDSFASAGAADAASEAADADAGAAEGGGDDAARGNDAGAATIAVLQTRGKPNTGTPAQSVDIPLVEGAAIVVGAYWLGAGTTVAVTDTFHLSWTPTPESVNANTFDGGNCNGVKAQLWYALDVPVTADKQTDTITVSTVAGGGGNVGVYAITYSGVAIANAFDVHQGAAATSATSDITDVPLVTTGANDVLVAVFADPGIQGGVITPKDGFSTEGTDAVFFSVIADRSNATPATYSVVGSLPAGRTSLCWVVTAIALRAGVR